MIDRQIRCQVQNGKAYEYESFCYFDSGGQAAYDKTRENSRKLPKWVKKLGVFKHEDIPFTTTLYNYIDLSLLETRNIDLPIKTRHNKKSPRNPKNKRILGELIEKHPGSVDK